jgi:hypothetical protein
MSAENSLKAADRKVFRLTLQHGLWDMLIGCYFLIFVIAPFLSPYLGDFWSSAVFVPFLGLAYAVIRVLKERIVVPRLGVVQFGASRKARLLRFNVISVLLLLAALICGFLCAQYFKVLPGSAPVFTFGIIVLTVFAVAGYYLELARFYLYGLLVFVSLPAGEWLYQHAGATHHGFPIAFGATSGLMMLTGLILFVRFVRKHPLPTEGAR